MRRAILASAAAAALSACTVGPDYRAPSTAAPIAWGPEPADVDSVTSTDAVDPRWWDSFHDPELTSLVARLVKQNIDLAEAAERVRQADAQREIARSQGLPHVDEQSSYMHERQSPNGFLSLITPAPYAPYVYDIWQNSLTASWEVDLFGRVRRAVEAQRADTEAAIEARHAIALDALATLAQDYLQYRGTEARLAIAGRNLEIARHEQDLVQQQFDQGVATTLNLADARAEVETIASTLPGLEAGRAQLVNAIGFLLAEPPRALDAELASARATPVVPPVVPVGLPSSLARRRPDVREAEARLHAATAETGVAVASFYPELSLSGSFGPDGRIVGNAFSLPSRMFQIGPTLDVPLFQGGRLVGTLHLRRSQQREAALAFRNTLLGAWRDVDDALTAFAEAQRTRARTAATVASDRMALAAAEQSFQQGAVDFLNVTNAQSALLQAEDQLAVSDTTVETDLVGLYKALGGGWQAA